MVHVRTQFQEKWEPCKPIRTKESEQYPVWICWEQMGWSECNIF